MKEKTIEEKKEINNDSNLIEKKNVEEPKKNIEEKETSTIQKEKKQ